MSTEILLWLERPGVCPHSRGMNPHAFFPLTLHTLLCLCLSHPKEFPQQVRRRKADLQKKTSLCTRWFPSSGKKDTMTNTRITSPGYTQPSPEHRRGQCQNSEQGGQEMSLERFRISKTPMGSRTPTERDNKGGDRSLGRSIHPLHRARHHMSLGQRKEKGPRCRAHLPSSEQQAWVYTVQWLVATEIFQLRAEELHPLPAVKSGLLPSADRKPRLPYDNPNSSPITEQAWRNSSSKKVAWLYNFKLLFFFTIYLTFLYPPRVSLVLPSCLL